MKSLGLKIAFLSAALAVTALSQAEILFFDSFHTQDFVQTSNTSSSLLGAFYASRIVDSEAGGITSGLLTIPGGTNYNMTSTPVSSGSEVIFQTNYYADEAALLAAFPSGVYNFAINDGGLHSGESATIDVGDKVFADTAPLLTNGSFDALTHADGSQTTNISWNPWAPASSGPNTAITFFSIYDFTSSSYVVSNSGDASSYVGETLLPGELTAGHQYEFDLYYSSRVEIGGAGFENSTSTDGADLHMTGLFTATPEPASMAVLGIGIVALLKKRAKRAQEWVL